MANIVTPDDYLASENQESFGTPEQIQEHGLNQMAAGLGRRAQLQHDLTGITDEDLDSENFDPQQAKAESLLNEAIANASKATNPADRMRWSAEAEKLAAALVGHQHGKQIEALPEEGDTFEELNNAGEDVQGVLGYAGEAFSDATIAELNPILTGKDKVLAKDTFAFIKYHERNPEWFVDPAQMGEFDQAQIQEIAEQYGDITAKTLEITALALKEGQITPTEMLRTLMKRPDIKRNVVSMLKSGQIVIPFA